MGKKYTYKDFVQQGGGVGWTHPMYRRGRSGAGFGSFFKTIVNNPTFQKVAKQIGKAGLEVAKDVVQNKKSLKQAASEQVQKAFSGKGKSTRKQAGGVSKKGGSTQSGWTVRNKKLSVKSASNQKSKKFFIPPS